MNNAGPGFNSESDDEVWVADGELPQKITVYWEKEYTTAIPPERLKHDFNPHRPLLGQMTWMSNAP